MVGGYGVVGRTAVETLAGNGVSTTVVDREGELLTDLGPEFVVSEDDALIVAGDDEAINGFVTLAC